MHKMQYGGGALDSDLSKTFFYLPSTVDRNEKINKYLNSVNLKPMTINHKEFGEDFDPSNWDLDRNVVEVLKKVALQSSENLKRNADAFLSAISHGNDKL